MNLKFHIFNVFVTRSIPNHTLINTRNTLQIFNSIYLRNVPGYFHATLHKSTVIRGTKTHSHVSCSQVQVHKTMCVIYMNQLLPIISCLYHKNYWASKSYLRCPAVLLPDVSNFKGICPAVPEICGSKSQLNFFIFFFFVALLNPFKNNFLLLRILHR